MPPEIPANSVQARTARRLFSPSVPEIQVRIWDRVLFGTAGAGTGIERGSAPRISSRIQVPTMVRLPSAMGPCGSNPTRKKAEDSSLSERLQTA